MGFTILCLDELGKTGLEFSDILKDTEFEIVSVTNSDEAINELVSHKDEIKAIVWTINSMASEDFDEIRKIKEFGDFKHIPVVIMSKYTDKKFIISAIESGAVEYIAKPYDEDIVIRKIRRIVGQHCMYTEPGAYEDVVTFNFSDMLSREIKAASRGGHYLSIMLVTIRAESSNQSYDEKIGELTDILNKVIKTKVRETDTIFRHGINNLLILLPFADSAGAKSVEKKIEEICKSHTLLKKKNKSYRVIAASVSYPEEGKIKDKLIEKLEKKINSFIEKKVI